MADHHHSATRDDRQAPRGPSLTDLSHSVAHVDVVELLGAALLASVFAAAARRKPRLTLGVLGSLAPLGILSARLGRRSGVTDAEVRRILPGDEIVARPRVVMDRGITVRAAAPEIWPWMVQMGYHRAGWYTNYWLDKLVWHIDNPSVDRVVPELQHLHAGDIVPDGPPGTAYWKVAVLEPGKAIVYLDDDGVHIPGVTVSWAIVLDPIDDHTTRVVTRTRAIFQPSLAMDLMARVLIGPADLVMTEQVLRGIKTRVEQTGRG